MGKVLSVAGRKARNFNVEERAHKIIGQDKPKRAPLHASNEEEIKLMMKENADSFEKLKIKDHSLDEKLKQIYVVSQDEKFGKPSDKSRLPQSRSTVETEFGYIEPDIIPVGKITLKQALQLFADVQASPSTITVDKITNDYKLGTQDSIDLLTYFTSFSIETAKKKVQLGTTDKILKVLKSNPIQIEKREESANLEQSKDVLPKR